MLSVKIEAYPWPSLSRFMKPCECTCASKFDECFVLGTARTRKQKNLVACFLLSPGPEHRARNNRMKPLVFCVVLSFVSGFATLGVCNLESVQPRALERKTKHTLGSFCPFPCLEPCLRDSGSQPRGRKAQTNTGVCYRFLIVTGVATCVLIWT